MDREFEIYCPHCSWRPAADDRWQCAPGCGTVWNTFWTRGLCPGCATQWQDTQCLACKRISLHRKWYHLPRKARRASTRKKREPTAA